MAVLIQWWIRSISVLLAVLLCVATFPTGTLGYWGLRHLVRQQFDGSLESHLIGVNDWEFTPERAAAWGVGLTLCLLMLTLGTLKLGWSVRLVRT
ncbi:MAG: hypothetical protein ACK5Q5_15855 [Planctomycetaceae bacterium]